MYNKDMPMYNKEKTAMCALNGIFGFRPTLGLFLLRFAGSAEKLFSMDKDSLRRTAGVYASYADKISAAALSMAEKELDRTYADGARFIGINEEGYPPKLKECPDSSIGLYIKSVSDDMELFRSRPAVAVVGTRDMTPYGKEQTIRLIENLAAASDKPVIISGLAYGIDITAHETALRCGLPTIAVLPTGIDRIYPSRHIRTAEKIAATPGCGLITDYPSDTAPLPVNFLRRNRIIAGLADAVILVESKTKGGGMMTARLAYSYDRDIYAVPGRINDIRSMGCNLLVREKIAEPVFDTETLAGQLGLGAAPHEKRKKNLTEIINEKYHETDGFDTEDIVAVAKAIKEGNGLNREEIASLTGIRLSIVTGITELLSADGIIDTDLLGHCYII